jgi:hypothetical protein
MPEIGRSVRSTHPAAPPRIRAAMGTRSLRFMERVMEAVGFVVD